MSSAQFRIGACSDNAGGRYNLGVVALELRIAPKKLPGPGSAWQSSGVVVSFVMTPVRPAYKTDRRILGQASIRQLLPQLVSAGKLDGV